MILSKSSFIMREKQGNYIAIKQNFGKKSSDCIGLDGIAAEGGGTPDGPSQREGQTGGRSPQRRRLPPPPPPRLPTTPSFVGLILSEGGRVGIGDSGYRAHPLREQEPQIARRLPVDSVAIAGRRCQRAPRYPPQTRPITAPAHRRL